MHKILLSVTKYFNLEIHSILSGQGRRGRPRTSAPEAPLQRNVEHTPRSEDASMNQPPTEPSRVANPGGSTLTMGRVIQIVTATTHQLREPPEEQRGMIERSLKLEAKTYDGTCNTPKYTLAVFDMFRVFCQHNLNVSLVKCEKWKFRYPEFVQDLRTILSFVKRGHKSHSWQDLRSKWK